MGAAADTSVSLIEVDAIKSFDLTSALNKLRGEYEKSVLQHKEDAETYFRAKVIVFTIDCSFFSHFIPVGKNKK